MKEIFEENRGLFGSNKILSVLQSRGYKTSKKTVLRLMCEMGLHSLRSNAKSDYKTWVKLHATPNVLNRQFNVDAPNATWVSDCTEFMVLGRKYHICAILDLYSRKIIAYKISARASTQLVTATFKLAFEARTPGEQLVFASTLRRHFAVFCSKTMSPSLFRKQEPRMTTVSWNHFSRL